MRNNFKKWKGKKNATLKKDNAKVKKEILNLRKDVQENDQMSKECKNKGKQQIGKF